jgi:hypothetical protein
MPVFPKGRAPHVPGLGKYMQYDAMGFSKTAPREGDIILTPRGVYWEVDAVEPYDQGDVNVYYLVGLTQSYLVASVINPPGSGTGEYGFEWVVEDVSGFDTEFERSTSPI